MCGADGQKTDRTPAYLAAVDMDIPKEVVQVLCLLMPMISIHWTHGWDALMLRRQLHQNLFYGAVRCRMMSDLHNGAESLLCKSRTIKSVFTKEEEIQQN